jgi:hypothetical protein
VFDYIEDARAFLRSAAALADGLVIATFPRAGTLRAGVRRVRLALKRCPVYFYSPELIEDMARGAGLAVTKREIIGQLHCVVMAAESA